MNEQGIYFPTSNFKDVIRQCGGEWNDKKERPLLCLVRSSEDDRLFWAIPMGDMAHRSDEQRQRIQKYIDMPKRDIRSCYYHIANTDKESLFFISDAVPITDEYIERSYLVNNCEYVIKNPTVILELNRKLKRILSMEANKPNCFRQHITDVKGYLLKTLL